MGKLKLLFKEYWVTLLIIIGIIVVGRLQPYNLVLVDGISMNPTLHSNEILLATHKFEIKKGDIVVFKPPEMWQAQNKAFIKRVIATEGDKIKIDKDGTLTVNGEFVKHLESNYIVIKEFEDTVPKDKVFVMGDNFGRSTDSYTIFLADISDFYIPTKSIEMKIVKEIKDESIGTNNR